MMEDDRTRRVTEQTGCDKFENAIREFGIKAACEWFGHDNDSVFTNETIEHLNTLYLDD